MEKLAIPEPDLQLLIQAICRTLFHSLWQGVVLAFAAGIAMILFRKSASALRYNVLCGLLLLFVLANLATLALEFGARNQPPQHLSPASHSPGHSVTNYFSSSGVPTSVDLLQAINTFLNYNAVPIVLLWLAVFLFKTMKMTTGIFYIHHLRKQHNGKIGDGWKQRLFRLSQKLGISEAVLLIESGWVQVPLSEGIFKPMILVPIGFLTSLPVNQVEAILLHELGHIKRKDSLANMLQSFIECFLFFNPAVLWVSSMIRKEREHCCDDLVVGVIGNRKDLAQALISFQENRLIFSANIPALTGGHRSHVLERVKRIIFNYNKPLNTMEKFILTSSFIAFSLISASFFAPKPETKTIAIKEIKHTETVSIAPKQKIKKEQKSVVVKSERVFIKKAAQPQDTLSLKSQKYLADIKAALEKNDLEKAFKLKYQLYLVLSNERGLIKRQKIENELLEKSIHGQKEQMIQLIGSDTTGEKFSDYQMKHSMLAMQKAVLNTSSKIIETRTDRLQKLRNEMEKESDMIYARRKEELKSMQEQLINDFIAEGVIKSRENLSFRLHNMSLIVNGAQQPEALHLKLKAKYIKQTWMEWVYNWDGQTGYRFTSVRYNG